MKISLIAALSKNKVIGNKGKIPWRLPKEQALFKKLTKGHLIIMGRKTYQSIGNPLSDRVNVVLTRNKNFKAKGVFTFNSKSEVLKFARRKKEEEIFIIGGEEIYKLFLPDADYIYLSKINQHFKGNAFFPKINKANWKKVEQRKYAKDKNNPFNFYFVKLEKRK